MSIHFPDWVSPALALARQTLESCHAPDSFDFIGQIDETLPREGYRMQLSPMESGKQTLRLSGGSDVGLMYGAMDFVNRIIPAAEQAHKWMFPYYFVNPFETGFAPMDETSSPSVARRGLWTWGHVIYDYRGYLTNMARLKLNELVIWNDFAPLNADEIVAFAHGLGIRIIWGYSWGWDTSIKTDLSDPLALHALEDSVVDTFVRHYAALPGDGIYFQSFTETAEEEHNGQIIADVVVRWVNRVCARILTLKPDLELQFGLHATSVRSRIASIAAVDPRIRIVWEDCGAFPYAYMPENLTGRAETAAFTDELAHLRPNASVGVVLKGMICLDWTTFVHRTAPERIGEASEAAIAQRQPMARRIMRLVQSSWLTNGGAMLDTVRQLAVHEDCQILALLEDGLFDRQIWFPAALFAAALWDCGQSIDQLIRETALRPDVVFA